MHPFAGVALSGTFAPESYDPPPFAVPPPTAMTVTEVFILTGRPCHVPDWQISSQPRSGVT